MSGHLSLDNARQVIFAMNQMLRLLQLEGNLIENDEFAEAFHNLTSARDVIAEEYGLL